MSTVPKYVFLGFFVLVIGALVGPGMYLGKMPAAEPPLQGAGSTFVNPLIVQWSNQFEKEELGFRIGYRSCGSGDGIKLFLDKRVNIACSEAPLTDEQIAQVRARSNDVVHIPLVIGGVVPPYNLPSVTAPLRFTGTVLADIYLGTIKKWNDKAIADLNPGIELPNQDIVVVHRSDGSGTTYIWVEYLAKLSADWKEKVGVGTEVKWPVGLSEDGNKGVAAKVHSTPGSIGYMELIYAYQLDLAFGLVQNREKEFVKASLYSFTKAAENCLNSIPDDLRFSLTDPPGKRSYPIAGATWAIVYAHQNQEKAARIKTFLSWAVGEGHDKVQSLLYARLPESLAERARSKIAAIAGAN